METETMPYKYTQEDIDHFMGLDAINVQNACNLSGVVHSFSDAMHKLREKYPGKGTDWYNRHPIAVLYANKIYDMVGFDFHFSQAYRLCERG